MQGAAAALPGWLFGDVAGTLIVSTTRSAGGGSSITNGRSEAWSLLVSRFSSKTLPLGLLRAGSATTKT